MGNCIGQVEQSPQILPRRILLHHYRMFLMLRVRWGVGRQLGAASKPRAEAADPCRDLLLTFSNDQTRAESSIHFVEGDSNEMREAALDKFC